MEGSDFTSELIYLFSTYLETFHETFGSVFSHHFFCKEEDNLPGTSDSVEDMQDGILIQ